MWKKGEDLETAGEMETEVLFLRQWQNEKDGEMKSWI